MGEGIDGLDPQGVGIRLREARKARRLTQGQAARSLGVARTTLTAIEKGQRPIRPDELIKLSDLYGRQVSYFLRATPGTGSVRAQLSAIPAASLAPEATDEFSKLCDDYAFLEGVNGVHSTPKVQTYEVTHLPPDRAGELLAAAERSRLVLGDGPVPDLRLLLEEGGGLRVFYLDLPSGVSALYAYTSAHGGCLAVARDQTLEVTRWDLAFEYGRFLMDRYKAHVLTARERQGASWADRAAASFAGSFLLPAEAISHRLDLIYRVGEAGLSPADVLAMAADFGVSLKTAVSRLEELRRLPRGAWADIDRAGLRGSEAPAVFGTSAVTGREEKLPRRYLLLAMKAYAQARISEGQLAEVLGTDRLGARDRVRALLQDTGVDSLDKLVEPFRKGKR